VSTGINVITINILFIALSIILYPFFKRYEFSDSIWLDVYIMCIGCAVMATIYHIGVFVEDYKTQIEYFLKNY
jgi:hypothetical protein